MVKRLFLSAIIFTVSVFCMAQTQSVTHVVQRGETIESIAEYYHVSVDDINKTNPNADGLVYVGMKLVVPLKNDMSDTTHGVNHEANKVVISQNGMTETDGTNEYIANKKNVWKRNEARIFGGVSYFAQNFSEVKLSGHYGITIDALNIGDSFFGFSTTLSSFNFGLVDKDATNDLILFGPNVSYEVVPNLLVALPLQAMCACSFEGTDTKTSWGWAVSPRAYFQIGSKVIINAGVLISGGFKKEDEATCGFTVGLGFKI